MCKDMYKRANDSLPIDGAKARVMARLEKPAVVKPYKRALEAVALAACLVFTFAAVSIYRDFENNNIEQNVIIKPDTPTNTSEPINLQVQEIVQETIKEDSIEPEKKVQAPIKKEIVPKLESPQKEVASVQIEEKPSVSRSIKVEERAVPKIEVAAEEIASQEIKTAIVINEEKPVSGGGAAAAALYMRDAQPLKELTKEEYYGYLGKNIEECVELPEGFENITQDAVSFETDEEGSYKNDEWSFVFQKEEKAVEVITTKNTETVQDFIDREDYSKSTVCGVDAVVTKDDAVYRAYMVSEERGYKITAAGLMETEVEGLLVSLVK